MPFPRTIEALEAAGYRYGTNGQCRGCGSQIQWFSTPAQKWMPFNMPNQMGEFDNHWSTCPVRGRFKKEKEKTAK